MYALATRITFICPMRFNAFPMDIQVWYYSLLVEKRIKVLKCPRCRKKLYKYFVLQVCKFKVGSFNYPMSKMTFLAEVIHFY